MPPGSKPPAPDGPSDETELPPAGFSRRLGALLYDAMLLTAVLFIATLLVLLFTSGEAVRPRDPLFNTYLLFVCFFYFAWPWVHGGRTLGMHTWHIRVLRSDGRPLTWWDALMRFIAALPSTLFFGLGHLWVLVDKRNRAIHDRWSDTKVVYQRRPPRLG